MKILSISLLFLVLFTINTSLVAGELEVMTYNVQNLFDTVHDEGKNDWEFLPKEYPGKVENCNKITIAYFRKKCLKTDWTEQKLQIKLDQIATVVKKSRTRLPDILALVEVENENVIGMLAQRLGYQKYVVSNSPDKRGIDLAVLFNPTANLRMVGSKEHVLGGKWFKDKPTRNILEVKFEIGDGERLNLFVNHWPSQSNPVEARLKAAEKLKRVITRRRFFRPKSYMLAVGDFNVIEADYPHPLKSVLTQGLYALVDTNALFQKFSKKRGAKLPLGTYFYRKNMQWNLLDRIYVSKNLQQKKGKSVQLIANSYEIFAPKVATRSFKYTRTNDYNRGTIVTGVPNAFNPHSNRADQAGFSDHFPVVVRLVYAQIPRR